MPQQPIRVGVVGVGRVGALHAHIYARLPDVTLAYVCDSDEAKAAQAARDYGGTPCTDFRFAGSILDRSSERRISDSRRRRT